MKKYVIASVITLALGVFISGQAQAAKGAQTKGGNPHTKDTSPPLVAAAVDGALGNNGWYIGNVSVTWQVSDPESRIRSTSGCDSVTVSSDTSGTSLTCTATSSGGTTIESVNVKRDATPPRPTIVTPGSGAEYSLDQKVAADFNCTDATSGVTVCNGTVADGTAIDTSTVGTKSFSVTAEDEAGNRAVVSTGYSVTNSGSTPPPVVSSQGTQVFAWNDLGMHCADSDFSVFTLLPPFNDLNAQLVVNGQLVDVRSNPDYSLTYEATADPSGSVNSTSQGKTNFWDFAEPLFGAVLAPDVGMTGFPMASYTPEPMVWNDAFNFFEATGIPVTPLDDDLNTNNFPMVKVTALDGSGRAIASSDTVLPISSEINCDTCHASNTGSSAAKPMSGWVDLTPGSEVDWRMNILRLHDERNGGNSTYLDLLSRKGYGDSLETSAADGRPVMCDGCHNSNALAVWGINGEGGVSNLTSAMHNLHAEVSLPGTTQTLDNIGTREACYNCHPGRDTQCLRGAMGNPVDSAGDHIMECQACHGSMQTVGDQARDGWFDMPTCQSCHHDGARDTVAINADGTLKTSADSRFASNPNTPVPGTDLYRYSTGHGNLQCEACHNSTHAEFTDKPSANGNEVNDNLRAVEAQGYAAAIRECTVCHATMPGSIKGGPHGMHSLGQSWVSSHEHAFSTESRSECYYCHGNNSSGSPLAVVKIAKTFNTGDGRTKTFAAGERVTCWSCHSGPNP